MTAAEGRPTSDPDALPEPAAPSRRTVVLGTAALAAAAGLPLVGCGGSSPVAADLPAAQPVPAAPQTPRPGGSVPRRKSDLYRRGPGDVAETEPVQSRTPLPASKATPQPPAEPASTGALEPAPPSKTDPLRTARRPEPAKPVTLGRAEDVPVGGGTVFAKQRVVVTQPTRGVYNGFDARCTNDGCLVSDVRGGTIPCPCCDSTFDIEDGSAVDGPAKRPLPARRIEVVNGEIRYRA